MKRWPARIIHAALFAGAYFSLLWWVPATRAIGFGFDWWIGVLAFHGIAIMSIVALFLLAGLLMARAGSDLEDVFMGSQTVFRAANDHRNKIIGVESNEEYRELAELKMRKDEG